MRKVLINNNTNSKLLIDYSNNRYIIDAGDRKTIDIDDDILRFSVETQKSLRLCIGQFFCKGEIRNELIFGLTSIVYPCSYFKVPENMKTIDVSERKYHVYLFTIFCVLTFNNKIADSYKYCSKRDTGIIKIQSTALLLPLSIMFFLLTITAIYGVIFEFSFGALIFLLICCLVLDPFLISVARDLSDLIKLNERAKNKISESKMAIINKDSGWLVKYYDI